MIKIYILCRIKKTSDEKVLQLKKVCNMKLLLFFISDISYIFSFSNTFFFAFSLHHLESQIDTYVKSHHTYKDTWTTEIGEFHDVQIETNNPVDKYGVCIQKFGKVVGHLKKGENEKFAKAIFFFLRGDPYSKAKQ